MKTKKLVEDEKAFLRQFIESLTKEPTPQEKLDRVNHLASEEIAEMKKLINELFIASSGLSIAQQPIVKEMQEVCRTSIQRFEHLVHRRYTKEEFDNLPETARADLRRLLEDRRNYFQSLIEKYGNR